MLNILKQFSEKNWMLVTLLLKPDLLLKSGHQVVKHDDFYAITDVANIHLIEGSDSDVDLIKTIYESFKLIPQEITGLISYLQDHPDCDIENAFDALVANIKIALAQ